MKTSFLPQTNEIIGMISAHYIIEQKFWHLFCYFLREKMSSWNYFGFYWPLKKHFWWNIEKTKIIESS